MIPTLIDYKEIFLTDCDGEDSTRYNYKRVFDLLLENFKGKYSLYTLNFGEIKNFRAFLSTKYPSRNTVNKYLSIFSTIYKTYWDTYKMQIYKKDQAFFITQGNPFKGAFYSKRELKNDIRKGYMFVKDHEFEKLLSAIQKLPIDNPEELSDITKVCRYMGLRRAEALDLEVDDIQKNYVIVNSTKTGELRSVPLFKEVAAILQRRKAANKRYIFSYSYSSLYKDFKKAVVLAEIDPNITLHTLRKTFGSKLVGKVPLIKISKFLGHSSIKTTEQMYIILVNNDHQKWLDIVDGKEEEEGEDYVSKPEKYVPNAI